MVHGSYHNKQGMGQTGADTIDKAGISLLLCCRFIKRSPRIMRRSQRAAGFPSEHRCFVLLAFGGTIWRAVSRDNVFLVMVPHFQFRGALTTVTTRLNIH